MKNHHGALLFTLLLLTNAIPKLANAQGSMAAAQPHLDKAKAAAWTPGDGLNDLTKLYEVVCAPALDPKGPHEHSDQAPVALAERKVPPRADWYQEPAKVFDNLYWLGSWGSATRVSSKGDPSPAGDATWAVTTSEGIILIDSGTNFTAPVLMTEGLKKMGLDPTQIKYVITSTDRYVGPRYLQDTYHARIILSEGDWNVLAKSSYPEDLKPKKDMVATDGMKLTLGDTTLTLYIMPGHSPGTISTFVPLKDGNDSHVGVMLNGINAHTASDAGVRFDTNLEENLRTWSASIARLQEIAANAGADTYLTTHPIYDNALEKIHLLQYRKPGEPNLMVGKANLDRFLTIIRECTDAQLARIAPTNSRGVRGQ